ncbi:PDZ domain-containing protein [Paenibacillus radicis (ex Gao et al. 2016)]|uniref:Membrane protein n=1 Tax=Paenibacillus radicis (ex Gao et al. 2016) TaxID=1737354 RepID=A0A917HNY8_9BACL|nr:PDZ domain-containing protein [Paenibacillus radicis (ex Gao et al. 2016)]GGG84717.1 membrane protein [Paenibacillus radicis (ex Gao et al. 2016)]
MDTALTLLKQLESAAVHLLAQPFYYIAVLFIALQYTRQIRLERQMFAVRLHYWPRLLGRAMLAGLLAGLCFSVIGAFIGAAITQETVLWLWGAAAVLMLFRIRYLCFAYGAGILALLQWLTGFFPLADQGGTIARMAASLEQIDMPGLLMLVALLHLAEALLVARQGDKLATPLFLEGKRGKLVGGYMLQGFWPVPLLLLVPAAGGEQTALPWTPLLGADWSQGWTVIALPMVIGFSELTRSMLPKEKAKHAAKGLTLFSVGLMGAALLAWWQPVLLPLAALVSLLLHEVIIWRSRSVEAARSPLFVNDRRGLRILGIVPETPAEAMGLQSGEILAKVNGTRVYNKEDLHAALQSNSALSKLEVLNHAGEVKFVQRARYAGDHHQLGVILAPDENANYYAAAGPSSLLELLRSSRTSNRRTTREKTSSEETSL